MNDLNRYVKKYASDWKDIGLELGLDYHALQIIEKDNRQCVTCLRETLQKWLDLNPDCATWKALELALTNVNRTNNQLNPVDDLCGKDVYYE